MKDFEASNSMALFLPSATPEPIVARLNAAAIAALDDPTLQTKLRALGAEPAHPTETRPSVSRCSWRRNVKSGARSFARPISAWSEAWFAHRVGPLLCNDDGMPRWDWACIR